MPPFSKPQEPKQITFKPLPKQWVAWQFLEDDEILEVLYGGGARGAKSYFLCSWQVLRRIRYPGSAGLIGRKELKRLKATTLRTMFAEVMPALGLKRDIDYRFNATDMTIHFPNGPYEGDPWTGGSIIYCVDLAEKPTDPEFDRLGSYTLTDCAIDEAQEVSYKVVNVLKARFSLTSMPDRGWKTSAKMLYTCNPAKTWIYSQFYKPHKKGTLVKTRRFVPALVTDNPYVPPEYVENLRNSDDEVTKQRLLYGNFEYDDDPTVIIPYDVVCDLFENNVRTGGKRYLTVDVARMGRDSTRFTVWEGLRAVYFEKQVKWDTVQTAERVKQLEIQYSIERQNVCIDQDGVGGGVVDQLRGCRAFTNGASPIQPLEAKFDERKRVKFRNLKTQCVYKFAELAKAGKIRLDVTDVAVIEELEQEIAQWRRQNPDDDEGPITLVPKDEVKERLGRSPDLSDSLIFRMIFELDVSDAPKAEKPRD